MDANKKVPGTMTQSEVLRRLLDWHKMELSIEKAKKDQVVARLEAKMAEAELHAAEANIERRQIVAPCWFDREGHPLDAVVVELNQHVGQWVQIGEPVMRLVRMDRLRVNGVLDAKQYRPSEIQDRPVEIAVTLPRLGRQTFSGQGRVRQAGDRGPLSSGAGRSGKPQTGRRLDSESRHERRNDNPIEMMNAKG